MTRTLALAALLLACGPAWSDPPVALYIFPAGGQRGSSIEVKVGGLFLHDRCGFELTGPGLTAPAELKRTQTLWLEGPLLPLPDSQRAEDYPKDMIGTVRIAADAPLGLHPWRVWTAQGVAPARRFVIGDLPEVIEKEVAGDPIPERVALPVTVNGRIFPNEDIDLWACELRKGQTITARVEAASLGSPLDSRLEVRDPDGRPLAENDDGNNADSFLRFTAPKDGIYQVKIHDINFKGSQAHVYRLTLTADAHVDRVFPLGGRRGTKGSFELIGQGLPQGPQAIDIPAGASSPFLHQIGVAGKRSNPFALDLDDLPEVVEGQDAKLSVPGIANGRITRPGEVDRWTFQARKGESLEIELRARKLGSPLTGVLAVEDAMNKILARAEASTSDPILRFTAPADGSYSAVVNERFASLGGSEFAYRLRISPSPTPDFRLKLGAESLTLPREGQVNLPISVEAVGGFRQPIALTVEGLPPDVTVTGTTIAAGQAAANLTFKGSPSTRIRSVLLRIRGTSKVGEKDVSRLAVSEVAGENVRLATGLATPFKVVGKYEMGWASRGSVARRTYRVERNGFTGPLTVTLADRQARHLQGVTGPTITVPPGATEFEYPVTLPPWMEIGRTCRVCVMATGEVVEPDGSRHTVSFNSINQNEQLVAVIEAGRLELALEPGSVRAEPGKAATVTVRVTRGKGAEGPVRVEAMVPAHVRGVEGVPADIPAGQNTGTLTIRFSGERPGPFNLPLTIRATLVGKEGPVTAEAKLDVGE